MKIAAIKRQPETPARGPFLLPARQDAVSGSFIPAEKETPVRWWDWLVLAAVVDLYLSRKREPKLKWWDWFVLGAAVLAPFL